MQELADATTVSPPDAPPLAARLQALGRRILAGNPCYLASAGLLLYGINRLTTDPKLVGAEFSLLLFNFCTLAIYGVLLAATAIALARRRIWYDALLLVGLTNLFVIVPFSLISRAVYLSPGLAFVMCAAGALLVAGQFWSFKRHLPELNLPGRLLGFGAVLLLANAAAPLLIKALGYQPAAIAAGLNAAWFIALPLFAALANLLPKRPVAGDAPGQPRWLPLAFYLGWIGVTVCHLGGIGYSTSFDWNPALIVPTAWVVAWTLHLRLTDFVPETSRPIRATWLCLPLFVPLLGARAGWVLPGFALLNVGCYGLRFALKDRSPLALIQLLGAGAICLAGAPASWLNHFVPEVSRAGWIFAAPALCFFWLIFLSRDPRVAAIAVFGLIAAGGLCLPGFARYGVQFGLVSLLAHSVRWDDRSHCGAVALRNLAGLLWLLLSWAWLQEAAPQARLPVYLAAAGLLVWHAAHMIAHRSSKPRAVPVYAAVVLGLEPEAALAGHLTDVSPGFLAIAASFLLFGAGSVAAFSKSKRKPAPPDCPSMTGPLQDSCP